MNRIFSRLAVTVLLMSVWTISIPAGQDTASQMTVYKSPTCGCCGDWVKIMTDAGFKVIVQERDDMDTVKKLAGIPQNLQACHTARIGGYLVEGHVPASTIKRLLSQKPAIRGISVPGMPVGSPGMGYDPDARYDVLTLESDRKQAARVYEQIGK